MIGYQTFLGGIYVSLDGKRVGAIKTAPGGFQYQPKGSKLVGDVFPTVADVKHSLEA